MSYKRRTTESITRYNNLIKEIIVQHPRTEVWFTTEKLNLLPEGHVLVRHAIQVLSCIFGKDKLMNYFNVFIFDDDSFKASMLFFFNLPTLLINWGYMDKSTMLFYNDLDDAAMAAADQLVVKELATQLSKAKPNHWEYNNLVIELQKVLN